MFASTLAVYLRTLAPSITWKNAGADSGDLVAAAFTGGIPHPPGYPLYLALAEPFLAFPVGGIAYRVNLLSAVSAAATVIVLYRIMRWLVLSNSQWRSGVSGVAALYFAFSPLFWSQATIAEVYALNALVTALSLMGLLLWSGVGDRERGSKPGKWLFAIALGLGLAHHPTIILVVPAALILLWKRVGLRELVPVAACVLFLAGGLSLSLIFRAGRDSPVNWGDPRTVPDWWAVVSGQLYRGYLFGLGGSEYPLRISAWARLLFEQFGAVGVALGLWGGLAIFRRSPRIALALSATMTGYSLFAIGYTSVDSEVYLIVPFLVFACGIAVGLSRLVAEWVRWSEIHGLSRRWTSPLWLSILLLFPVVNLAGNWAAMDLSGDTQALDYGRQVLATVPDDALIIADGDRYTFSLWYARYVEHPESHVTLITAGLLDYGWYQQMLRRHHPGWVWPDDTGPGGAKLLEMIVTLNLERRAVFWTGSDPQFQQVFEFRPVGALYRVSPKP